VAINWAKVGGLTPKAKTPPPIAQSAVRGRSKTRRQLKQPEPRQRCTFCIMGPQVVLASELNLGRRRQYV